MKTFTSGILVEPPIKMTSSISFSEKPLLDKAVFKGISNLLNRGLQTSTNSFLVILILISISMFLFSSL